MDSLLAAILEEFDILTSSRSPGEIRRSNRLKQAFAAFEDKVVKLHVEGTLRAAPLETLTAFAGQVGALCSLHDELSNIRKAMAGLPRPGEPQPEATSHVSLLPTIDWFWLKVGIKGGLAVVISVLLLKWIHPPGGSSAPIWAWLFVVLGRKFFRFSGTGDLRAFQTTLGCCMILSCCAGSLILITPPLANYAVMNLVLFVILFTTGFLTAGQLGLTFWIEFTVLTISTFVSLNPQVPLPAQTIIDSFLGIMFGMFIGAFVGRLLWPILPQRVLRDSLLQLIAGIKALLNGGSRRIGIQLESLPEEALWAIDQNRVARCSEEEKGNMRALISALQILVVRIEQLVCRRLVLRSLGEGGVFLRSPASPDEAEDIVPNAADGI
jgi:uncharacterized membrane protein YccC